MLGPSLRSGRLHQTPSPVTGSLPLLRLRLQLRQQRPVAREPLRVDRPGVGRGLDGAPRLVRVAAVGETTVVETVAEFGEAGGEFARHDPPEADLAEPGSVDQESAAGERD